MISAPYQPDTELREAVLQQIAKVIYDAQKAGLDGYTVARRTFPDTPGMVLGEALYIAEEQQSEEWWLQVEQTLDGEAVRKVLVSIADKSQEPK